MDIKAVLLDLDGTALQSDQVFISVKNMYAIRKALDKGVFIIPSTGRAVAMMPPQIEAEPRIRYWVTSGGARVYDHKSGKSLYSCTWTPGQSAELCRLYEGKDIYSEIAANGNLYVEKSIAMHLERYHIPPNHVWYIEMGRLIAVERPSEYFLANNIGIEKINIYNVPENEREDLYQAFESTDIAYMTGPAGRNMQVFQTGLDRLVSIGVLLNELGITMDEVMCIGDSAIDEECIMAAGVGVAMGNAPEWLKEEADYVTLSSDEDGVAEVIEKFIL